ncbi:MAG: xanthine dehydrogenase family protein subunit M [Dehalococcoidia bacterium]
MKPASFEYYAPSELDEALSLLQQHGDDAKVLAGGQSLVPLMNMRLARPSIIVDINGISELEYINRAPEGGLHAGALARQRALERSSLVREISPLISEAMPLVGHFQIRNRGTIGGSVAHADPAGELSAICIALDGEVVLRSTEGERGVKAEELFVTYFTTAIEPTELLTQVRFPAWVPGRGWGFEEVARRHGDFALVGAIALVELDPNRACAWARITLFGVDGTPVRAIEAEESLQGRVIDQAALEGAAALVSDALDPESDLHASAQYRKEVGGVMARRALAKALARTEEGAKA